MVAYWVCTIGVVLLALLGVWLQGEPQSWCEWVASMLLPAAAVVFALALPLVPLIRWMRGQR